MIELAIVNENLRAALEEARNDYRKTWQTERVFNELEEKCGKALHDAYKAGRQAAFEEVRELALKKTKE